MVSRFEYSADQSNFSIEFYQLFESNQFTFFNLLISNSYLQEYCLPLLSLS